MDNEISYSIKALRHGILGDLQNKFSNVIGSFIKTLRRYIADVLVVIINSIISWYISANTETGYRLDSWTWIPSSRSKVLLICNQIEGISSDVHPDFEHEIAC